MSAQPVLDVIVYGTPESAGSKTADPVMRRDASGRSVPVVDKNGRPVFRQRDSNKRSYAWKDAIAQVAATALEGAPLLLDAVWMEFVFYRPRNEGHYGSGRNRHLVKDSAPAAPIVAPDVLKLARAAEDALTGVLYKDDAQITREVLEKRFGEPARVEIRAWLAEAQSAADLPPDQRVRAGSVEPEYDLQGTLLAA